MKYRIRRMNHHYERKKLFPSKPVKKRKRLQKVQAEVEENTELELEEDIQRPSMPPKKKKVGKPKLQQVGPCLAS